MQKTIREQTPRNFIRLEKFLWHMCRTITIAISKKISVFYQISSLEKSKYHFNNT